MKFLCQMEYEEEVDGALYKKKEVDLKYSTWKLDIHEERWLKLRVCLLTFFSLLLQ